MAGLGIVVVGFGGCRPMSGDSILDTGYSILDTGYSILDTGYSILEVGAVGKSKVKNQNAK